MAAQKSASAAADDAWSKLPDDLLGEVYARIASPLDRVRFTAVCRSWRVVTPAETFPWLILPWCAGGTAKRVFCPVDGASLRVLLPPKAISKRMVGAHDGGWIAATSTIAGDELLLIVNLFSGVEALLSAKQRSTPWMKKLVFSEAPAVDSCILATILGDGIAVCRVGCRNHGWLTSKNVILYDDIAFCHGKLYGLLRSGLFIHDIHMNKAGNLVSITVTCVLGMNCVVSDMSYIFEHNDKLLMAKKAWWSVENKGSYFKVFELVIIKNTPYRYRWAEVTTLDDHALFLSTKSSKMVYVPAGKCGRAEGNHIYYNDINLIGDAKSIYNDVQLTRCDNGQHLYCKEDQKFNGLGRIMSIRYYGITSDHNALMWLFPLDF